MDVKEMKKSEKRRDQQLERKTNGIDQESLGSF